MYLKRVEMSGFKSFADRTVIEFEQGLTAIVGPNGSGKSNVTEAIRWVLGEQSAKNLRGDKMYDVIFSGTSKRKPLNVCEVIITLDNSDKVLPYDYEEVSVMRRLTRDGDSYYAINKKQCRLKDIVELFMDSGLGKNSFSIISQGKIEAIFDDKPENRRALFEETAGVLKYKQRKAQAENKLNETEDNLDRLDDILYEIGHQLEPLKNQMTNALKYKEWDMQLKKIDLSLKVFEINKHKEQYDLLNIEIPKQKSTIVKLEQQLEQLKKQQLTKKNQFNELESNIEKLRTQLVLTIENYEKKQALHQINLERQETQKQTTADLKQIILEETANKTEISAKVANEKTKLYELEQDYQNNDQKLQSKQEELVKLEKSLLIDVDELNEKYFDYLQKQATVKNEKTNLERQLEREKIKYQKNNAQEETNKAQYQKLKNEISSLNEEYQKLEQFIAQIDSDINQLETTINYEQSQVESKQNQIQKINNLYQQALIKKRSLDELQNSYSGFYTGVKLVLQAKKQLTGICGAVAECLKVDNKYTIAIETAIGSAMQNIIVENENSASRAIEYLKNKQQGRATFLPLNIIKSKKMTLDKIQQLKNMQGFLGLGIDLVSFDEKYYNVFSSLLGQTIVVDNLSNANRISKLMNYQFKVVTLEGEIIRPGGSMTGGINKNSGNLLNNKNELQALTDKIPDMEKQLTIEKEKLNNKIEIVKDSQNKLQSLNSTKQNNVIQLKNLEKQLAVKEQSYNHVKKEYQVITNESQHMTEFVKDYEMKIEDLTKQEEWLIQEASKIKETIDYTNQSRTEQQKQKEVILQQITTLKTTVDWQKKALVDNKQRLTDLHQQLEEAQAKINQANAKLKVMDSKLTETEIKQLKLELEELNIQKSNFEEDIEKAKQEKYEQSKLIDKLNEEIELLVDKVNNQNTKYQNNCLQFEQLDKELDKLLDYLNDEYHFSYELALEKASPLESSELEAKQQVKDLQQKIKQLGPINLASIEQYEELNQRHSFIIDQRQDLLDAKSQLLNTMSEMDQNVKIKFKQTFDSISKKFTELFPEIFGGGYAKLILTDEDDLLHTGIEIEAQPPGKKLQSLSLLSGGERALTAITLLFSMIQVRPVPFCILDEVEAALDEANVFRFGQYLQRLDDQTQFIVITHRRGTMEAAKILYGVTMQESGVSNLVSVKMDKLEKELKK